MTHTTPDPERDPQRLERQPRGSAPRSTSETTPTQSPRNPVRAQIGCSTIPELAHVVQQARRTSSGPLTVSNPGDALETEADAVADELA